MAKKYVRKKSLSPRITHKTTKPGEKKWYDLDILLAIPTRSRPEQTAELIKETLRASGGSGNIYVHLLCDIDDPKLDEYVKIAEELNGKVWQIVSPTIPVTISISEKGKNQTKISAVNESVSTFKGSWDICIVLSDDFVVEAQLWDITVRRAFQFEDGYDLDRVLFTSDGFTFPRLNTLSILGKKYYDRFGYVYHPSYKSWYSDNEFMQVSRLLYREFIEPTVLFRHNHPMRTNKPMDELYRKNDLHQDHDRVLFMKRMNAGFGLV